MRTQASSLPDVPSGAELLLAEYEGALRAFGFDSGASTIDAVLRLVPAGSSLLVPQGWRGGAWSRHAWVRTLAPIPYPRQEAVPFVREHLERGAAAVVVETPSLPGLDVADIAAFSRLASSHGALLIVDNTAMTGILQRPLELGADVVLHTGTGMLSGHSPSKGGFAAVRTPGLAEELARLREQENSQPGAGDAWLVLQGLRTLPQRVLRAQETATRLAVRLAADPRIAAVRHLLNPAHAGHALQAAQGRGPGWNLAIELVAPWAASTLLRSVRVWSRTEGGSGGESTIAHPWTGSHRDLPESVLEGMGTGQGLVLLTVGMERFEDLAGDLERALSWAQAGASDWVI